MLPSPLDTPRLSIAVRASNGAGPVMGWAEVVPRSSRERLRQSGLILAGGVAIGLLFLPVPLLHFLGILAFLASVALAGRRWRISSLVRRAGGRCPACRQDTGFYVAGGHLAARWPASSSCHACGIGLRLTLEEVLDEPGHQARVSA